MRNRAPMGAACFGNTDGTDGGCAAHGPRGLNFILVRVVRGREAAFVPSVLPRPAPYQGKALPA